MDIINTELVLKDLETVEKRLGKLEQEGKVDKEKAKQFEALKLVKEALLKNDLALPYRDESIVQELQLLTAKKQLYLLNGDISDVSDELKAKIKALGADYLAMDLKGEGDIAGLIRKGYEILDLISFFTTGEDETRAWTIQKGMKAPQAAGVIHTDFEKKFIRAEVIGTDKLLECGGWSKAKQKGQLRLEGKEYIVQDGDVIEVRHG